MWWRVALAPGVCCVRKEHGIAFAGGRDTKRNQMLEAPPASTDCVKHPHVRAIFKPAAPETLPRSPRAPTTPALAEGLGSRAPTQPVNKHTLTFV